MPEAGKAATNRARRRDRIARWVVTLGGMAVIASVIAILFLTAGTALPLFRPGRADVLAAMQLPRVHAEEVVDLDVERSLDESVLGARVFTRTGTLALLDLRGGRVLANLELPAPKGVPRASLQAVQNLGGAVYSLLWSNGALSVIELAQKSARWSVAEVQSFPAPDGQTPVAAVVRRPDAEHSSAVLLTAGNRLEWVRQEATENLLGEVVRQVQRLRLISEVPGRISAVTTDSAGRTVYAGTSDGCLVSWQINPEGKLERRETIRAFTDGRSITTLTLLAGDVTLAVGDAGGHVSTWLPRRYSPSSPRKLMAGRNWAGPEGRVKQILPAGRSKSLLELDSEGVVHVFHATSGRRLLTVSGETPLARVAWNVRGDTLLGLDERGRVTAWNVRCPHPEVSWTALFGRVLYEGYDAPAYVWQTTGGEDYEAKFSLVPLLFGTLKGTFYAMLLAAPLAVFGAIYNSYFTPPGLRRFIKPAIEVMAALPSVVIGFLAALWLAPMLQRGLLTLLLGMITVPLTLIVFLAIWRRFRGRTWAKRVEHGYEFLAVVPVLLLGVVAAFWLATVIEPLAFHGDFTRWLNETWNLRYDQRNSVVIAFALGLAVMPLVFSLTDEALSNVPHSLSAASLALGASRWQTLWRVVLPSASPAIFAAMMIGFGRAVGETMIVLMATGNTPIIDPSPLDGMRTLSANIAVEIPEAPVGGTLFRILFLCAVLLFVLTFTLNTVAEVVRQRLRRRYGQY